MNVLDRVMMRGKHTCVQMLTQYNMTMKVEKDSWPSLAERFQEEENNVWANHATFPAGTVVFPF